MKKIGTILLVWTIFLSLCACGEYVNANDGHNEDYIENYGHSTDTTNTMGHDSSTENSVQYISDRRVQYNEADKEHVVFFGLKNSNKQYVSASGTANITIIDDSSYTLLSKTVRFTDADFCEWTNQSWDSSRYMCGLYIADSELEGSASSSGTLTLEVTLDDNSYFSAKSMKILDLPSLTVSVELPTIPSQYIDDRYSSYTSTVEVTKLEYESSVSYDGTASLDFTLILKLVSKTGRKNESDTVCIGYKIYDSNGIVVDSGTIYSDPVAVGESVKDTLYIYGLDPRDTYVLKFEDAS